MKLSAIVLTKNEEANIPECLRLLGWADEIVVVDSDSTDRTRTLAEDQGARVICHPFFDFSAQRNFALQEAKGDWVLFIDADERVTPGLAKEIRAIIDGNAAPQVYAIPRKTFFFGKPLRFSDARNDSPSRLFPRLQATWTQPVHEKLETTLPCQKLDNPILHYSTRNLAHYKKKIHEYVPLELATMKKKRLRPGFLNVLIRPPAKFLSLYFWQLGILDGITGFQYAILSAYYTLVKHWLYYQRKGRSFKEDCP